jgi:hypothetical protein
MIPVGDERIIFCDFVCIYIYRVINEIHRHTFNYGGTNVVPLVGLVVEFNCHLDSSLLGYQKKQNAVSTLE